MLKGLMITPPVVGRIMIGKVVEVKGQRLPQKDDQFTLTTQLHNREGWLRHPLDATLREQQGGKLRHIPVRLAFNDPLLNLRAQYSLFDRDTARPLCVGDGEHCRRLTREGVVSLPCPAPEGCELAQGGRCKPYGRLNVLIGDDDPLGSFIFRTTGFNSIRTLTARLQYFHALSSGRLACLPLALRLRGKSTRQSFGTPIFYVDLTLRDDLNMAETLQQAQALEAERVAMGFDQAALDEAARQGLANGAFEDSTEEASDVIEEFYPDPTPPVTAVDTLSAKLKGTLSHATNGQAPTPPKS